VPSALNGSTASFEAGEQRELFPTRIRLFADHFAYDVTDNGQKFFMAAFPAPTEAGAVRR